jgi:type IX secretion system PorP/SprF family membrane protein
MKKPFVFVACVFLIHSIEAQDQKSLNSNQNLLYLNPSFAGSNGGVRVQLAYQHQWPEISYHFVTYHGAVDFYVPSLKAGIGVSVMQDNFKGGLLKTNFVNVVYAQYLKVCEHLVIIPSVRISYFEKRVDWEKVTFGDLLDPRGGGTVQNPGVYSFDRKSNFDFSGGGLINVRKDFYLGVYYFHMNQPDEGLLGANKLHGQLAFYGSYNHKLSSSTLLQFAARLEGQNDYWYNQLNLNAVWFSHLITGIGITNFEGVTANLGMRLNQLSITGSYNVIYSKLAGSNAAIWELGASLNLRDKQNRRELVKFENW